MPLALSVANRSRAFWKRAAGSFSKQLAISRAIVGGMYDPIHKQIAVPRGRLAEEHPVGVVHEEEDVSVPSAREDRTVEDRSAVKVLLQETAGAISDAVCAGRYLHVHEQGRKERALHSGGELVEQA